MLVGSWRCHGLFGTVKQGKQPGQDPSGVVITEAWAVVTPVQPKRPMVASGFTGVCLVLTDHWFLACIEHIGEIRKQPHLAEAEYPEEAVSWALSLDCPKCLR